MVHADQIGQGSSRFWSSGSTVVRALIPTTRGRKQCLPLLWSTQNKTEQVHLNSTANFEGSFCLHCFAVLLGLLCLHNQKGETFRTSLRSRVLVFIPTARIYCVKCICLAPQWFSPRVHNHIEGVFGQQVLHPARRQIIEPSACISLDRKVHRVLFENQRQMIKGQNQIQKNVLSPMCAGILWLKAGEVQLSRGEGGPLRNQTCTTSAQADQSLVRLYQCGCPSLVALVLVWSHSHGSGSGFVGLVPWVGVQFLENKVQATMLV